MFRKENSSLATAKANKKEAEPKPNNKSKKGKKGGNANTASAPAGPSKALDTPLRKSDIRHLKQQALDFFRPEDSTIASILDQVFVPNLIATRQLHHAELGKLTLYVRTPNVKCNNDATDFVWPYVAPQIVWIAQPPMPNTKQKEVAIPTVALLSVLPPNSMPTVAIPSEASTFLCRGAHLMRAGMRSLPEEMERKEEAPTGKAALLKQEAPRIVAIAALGNPQPLAVALLDNGVRTLADIGPATKGVGATVWTCYGDDLWKQQADQLQTVVDAPAILSPYGGANYNEGHYGNVGFLQGQGVVPLFVPAEDEDIEEAKNTPLPAEGEATTAGEPSTTEATSQANEESAEPNPQEEEDGISQGDLLHQAVCKALLTSLSPKELPLTVANFYANHVLPSRPQNTTIQLKQTKYKKFGNYLQEQVQRNLLTLGPGPNNKKGADPTAYLVAFDKRHADLLHFQQDHSTEVQQAKEEKQALQAASNLKLVLVNLYVVPHHLVQRLKLDPDAVKAVNASSAERAGTGFLTAPEVRALLEEYCNRENLLEFDQVLLDGPLFDALYKKKKNKGETSVTNDTLRVSRKEMNEQWVAAMNPAYALVQMPGSKIQTLGQGQPPKVLIEVSMRQSKKYVTKLRGMEAYGINGAALAKDLGKRLACQATVETVSETRLAKGCVEIVLGGNFADELEALLLGDEKLCPGHGGIKNSDHRLPKGSIDVVLRKGVPARKNRGGGKKKKKG